VAPRIAQSLPAPTQSGAVPEPIFRAAAAKRHRPLISRIRFQVLGGLLVCVLVPYLLREGFVFNTPGTESGRNAMIGAAFSFLVGYYFYWHLSNYPAFKAGGNLLFAIFVPFAATAILFLLLRLDYSRFIFLLSFFASFGWLVWLKLIVRSTITPVFSVVPGEHAEEMTKIGGVGWEVLSAPTAPGSVQAIVADLRQNLSKDWEKFIVRCTLAGKPVYHYKDLKETLTGKVEIEHMSENSFGSLLPNLVYLKLKRVIDFGLALLMLPLLLAVYLLVAPAIFATSGFPTIFVQERIGYRGRRFRMYKFRTMNGAQIGNEERDDAITRAGDLRITRVGRLLRTFRIDELPQIINILRGEMSWIGPRPEAVSLSKWYEDELAFYPYRHVVRPGISGWAQVNQGHVTSTDHVLEKLHYDFFYIKYLSPWLDLVIFLRTIRAMLTGFGAK
jgi:lipopolysaccharide/colanic/teichoic acid biosynthesis glycosyltransferase